MVVPLVALSVLAACGDQEVSGPTPSEFQVGIVAMVGAPSGIEWPSGDVLRVSVTRNGAPVEGAIVSAGEARMEERSDYYEPATAPDFGSDSLIAIEVRLPGFTYRDTLTAPTPALVLAPMSGADLRGCGFVAFEWRGSPDVDSAWVLIEGDSSATVAVTGARGSATIAAPSFTQASARVRVLSLERPSAFPHDRAFPAIIPAGSHHLAWSEPIEILLDPQSPLEVAAPESLFVALEAQGDTVRILWAPDTVRVHRLTVSTQFFAEGNLRWQIVSDDGFLSPVLFGSAPAGSRACAPAGAPGPIQPGVEYFVEVIGKRHAGSTRDIPLAARNK
jgi:hypothetical protein